MPVDLFSATKWKNIATSALSLIATPIRQAHLLAVAVKISAVPTTSENLTVVWHDLDSTSYSTELLREDPATESVQNIIYLPESKLVVGEGDTIEVSYPNSDGNTVAAQIMMEVGRA